MEHDIIKIYKELSCLCRSQEFRESIVNISVVNFNNGSKIYFDNGVPVKIELNNDYVIDINSPCLKEMTIIKEDMPELVLTPSVSFTDNV